MSNMGSLAPITSSTTADRYLVRQSGIDYTQTRDVVAENFRNSRWNSTVDYLQHSETKGSDGVTYIALQSSGPNNGGSVDPVTDTGELHWEEKVGTDVTQLEASPRNGDWNGYFDLAHQEQLPSKAGYPADSGSGGTVYALNDEWSLNCFSGSAGNTISSDVDGVVFTGSIYKKYEYTAEQIALIDVNKVPVFIKAQDGKAFYLKNGDVGVTTSKAGTTLTVTIDAAIFGVDGIDKIWRFFVTDKVGGVVELSPESLFYNLRYEVKSRQTLIDVLSSRVVGVEYVNNTKFDRRIHIELEAVSEAAGLFVSYVRNGETLQYGLDETNGPLSARTVILDTIRPGETYRIIDTSGTLFIPQWFEDII